MKRTSPSGPFGSLSISDQCSSPILYAPGASPAVAAATTPLLTSTGPDTLLQAQFSDWEPGDILLMEWNVQATPAPITDITALAFLVATVDIGTATLQYVDNSLTLPSQLGVAPALIAFSAPGRCAVQINDFESPPRAQLGLGFFSPTPTDRIRIGGIAGLGADPQAGSSGWLTATRIGRSSGSSAPASAVLRPLPIPTI